MGFREPPERSTTGVSELPERGGGSDCGGGVGDGGDIIVGVGGGSAGMCGGSAGCGGEGGLSGGDGGAIGVGGRVGPMETTRKCNVLPAASATVWTWCRCRA